ncbi:hypothetical protein [Nonomuraea sp. NPDC049141]
MEIIARTNVGGLTASFDVDRLVSDTEALYRSLGGLRRDRLVMTGEMNK